MRTSSLLLMLIATAAPAFAQTDASPQQHDLAHAVNAARMRAIDVTSDRLGAEQRSLQQEIRDLDALGRLERHEGLQPLQRFSSPALQSFEDIVRDPRGREYRLQDYATRIERLQARDRELQDQTRRLGDRLEGQRLGTWR